MFFWFKKEKTVKREIRIIGIDDAPFSKEKKGQVLVLGCIHRGGQAFEGLISSYADVDGDNSTEVLIQMINKSKHKDQLQCIMTDGIAVGGFNIIDINELSSKTKLPVVVIMRNKPNIEKMKAALKNVPNYKEKQKLLMKAGKIYDAKLSSGSVIYFQCAGIDADKAREIIKVAVSRGNMPEPVRTAHVIASGLILGESRGRA
jgi:hypothetical protein